MDGEFSSGDSVRITNGPLSDFVGEIIDVNPDERRLKVLVDILEREVPVELGFDQVEPLRPPGDGGAGAREPRGPFPESPKGTETVEPEA